MKNWKILFVLLALSSAVWLACNKDVLQPTNEGPMVRVSFAGVVVGEQNKPLIGARVRVGGQAVFTDENGVFRLPEVSLPANNAILQVEHTGYFSYSRAFFVEKGSIQNLNIQLLYKQPVHSFVATQSATAQVGDARLHFPANSVARADGSAYSGIVQVHARYLDPTDPDLGRHMPGDLRGITTGGEEQTLATFGMIGVELSTPAGDPLQVAAGEQVELEMPIPAEKLAAAPDRIPLWHYDDETARWIEEGAADKVGDRYVGKVSHFSFWNCDAGFPLIKLDGQIFLENNEQPLTWASVRLTIVSSGWHSYGNTDQNGYFGGGIPVNETLLMEVLYHSPCGTETLYSETIGPFQNNTTLPSIILQLQNSDALAVSGRLLDCAQQPVVNGYVQYDYGFQLQQAFTDANGAFSFTTLYCNTAPLSITGYDLDALTTSQIQTYTNPVSPLQTGDITVCTGLDEYIQLLFDGQSYLYTANVEALDEGGQTSITSESAGQYIWFSFINSGQTGTFPIEGFYAFPAADTLNTFNLNTTVTQFGGPNQVITGTIDGTVQIWNGQNYAVSGSYRVNQ
ncbi:MAG: hypothetical protein EP344_14155 [Bacteroidetes bacterium]|nr:MAG: hypothetical protein EP344_14155 [Bacteroidota bacterium]